MNTHVSHPHFETAWNKLFELGINSNHRRGKIILVPGASRAGKTHMFEMLLAAALERAASEAWTPPPGYVVERVPVLATEAIAPQKGHFSYDELNDEFLDALVPMNDGSLKQYQKLRKIATRMKICGTKWLLLDESHLLLERVTNSDADKTRLRNQLESLKTLINKTHCVLVLFGDHQLMKMLEITSQVSTKILYVPISPYNMADAAERDIFFSYVEPVFSQHGYSQSVWNDKAFMATLGMGCGGSIGILDDVLHTVGGPRPKETLQASRRRIESLLLSTPAQNQMWEDDMKLRKWVSLDQDGIDPTNPEKTESPAEELQARCNVVSIGEAKKPIGRRPGRKKDERPDAHEER